MLPAELPGNANNMQQPFLAFTSSTAVLCRHTIRAGTCGNSYKRAVRATPRLSVRPSNNRPTLNIVPSVAYAAYFSRLFIFPPFAHDILKDLKEAWNLSLNFGYVIPILFPHSAPVTHPMLEALFHFTVAWAFLLVGFAAHDVLNRGSKPPFKPFVIAALFFTNIVFLPYLALRSPSTSNSDSSETNIQPTKPLPEKDHSSLIKIGESLLVPVGSLALCIVSIPWALFARPEFGSITARFDSFVGLTTTSNILSFSFVIDCIVFTFFQSALVDNDAYRRSWSSQKIRNQAVTMAKLVPFVGLAFYLIQRSRFAPLQWSTSDEPE